jgi:hypothetical protein
VGRDAEREMKKEVRLLRRKAIDSLILSIEHFNRPSETGRVHSVLIFLDHAFEMLFKAIILHRGGRIREKRSEVTIGFDACVRKGLSDGSVKFLTEERALTVQTIHSLRDAAQHHILDISEAHLYIHAQARLSLFRDIMSDVFGEQVYTYLPARASPLSTTPPVGLAALFDHETTEVKRLLLPKTRRRTEVEAKLRSLAIVDKSLRGQKTQPSVPELRRLAEEIVTKGKRWEDLFPGVASISLTAHGDGPSVDLRISKTGVPIKLVSEGTPDATVVAVKRVDDLSFYSLGRDQLAKNLGLSGPKTTAAIRYLDLKTDTSCYRQITIGKSKFDRYSPKAIEKIHDALKHTSIDAIWKSHRVR